LSALRPAILHMPQSQFDFFDSVSCGVVVSFVVTCTAALHGRHSTAADTGAFSTPTLVSNVFLGVRTPVLLIAVTVLD
jgi:hypothetical protein